MESNNKIRQINKQANYEAHLTLAMYTFYFIWWCMFTYGFSANEPTTYKYIIGFPVWFFYSCLVGFPLLCCIVWITVRQYFKDISLDVTRQN